jgi:hypothetical protein
MITLIYSGFASFHDLFFSIYIRYVTSNGMMIIHYEHELMVKEEVVA